MSVLSNSETKTEFSIHPKTMMGAISLKVGNLENQQALGFKLHWREGSQAGLGAPSGDLTTGNADLLLLTEEPNLKKYRGATGLYHVAYVFPNRRELAIVMARLFALKYP